MATMTLSVSPQAVSYPGAITLTWASTGSRYTSLYYAVPNADGSLGARVRLNPTAQQSVGFDQNREYLVWPPSGSVTIIPSRRVTPSSTEPYVSDGYPFASGTTYTAGSDGISTYAESSPVAVTVTIPGVSGGYGVYPFGSSLERSTTPAPPPPPPAPGIAKLRKLIVPAMTVDAATGRLTLALGMATYTENYVDAALPASMGAPAGAKAYSWASAGSPVAGYGVRVCSQASVAGNDAGGAPFVMPWSTGKDAGQSAGTNLAVFPDGLVDASQQGVLRLGVQAFAFGGAAAAGFTGYFTRESLTLGKDWSAGPSLPGAATAPFPAARTLPLETADARKAAHLLAASTTPSTARGNMMGASGFVRLRERFIALLRMPKFASRGAGAYSAFGSPAAVPLVDGAQASTPAGKTGFPFAVVSGDGGRTFTYQAEPGSVGSVSAAFLGASAPGYPFPHEAVARALGGADASCLLAGAGALQVRPGSPLGIVAVAAGRDLENGSAWVFSPCIVRPPIPREFYPVPATFQGKQFPDGAKPFKQHTDPEFTGTVGQIAMKTGRDYGERTAISWCVTGDGGRTFGPLGVVQVQTGDALAPLLCDTCDVRLAAAAVPGGEAVLCVCDRGYAALYSSKNGCSSFAAVSYSADGGATWKPGPPPIKN